jgi:hypothetical protein
MINGPQPTPRPIVVSATGTAAGPGDSSGSPIHLSFMYDVASPYSVLIDLAAPSGHGFEEDGCFARWEVARETLESCAEWGAPSGSGDFFAFLAAEEGAVTMRFMETARGNGVARRHTGNYLDVTVPRQRLRHFLKLSKFAVPFGREENYLDIDACVAGLLGGHRHS